MAESTQPDGLQPDEIYGEDPIVARNIRILERSFIPNTPDLPDPEEQDASRWTTGGERMVGGKDTIITSVRIRFDTRTGKIIGSEYNNLQSKDGDISILRTYLITENEQVALNQQEGRWDTTPGKYRILLAYPPDWLTPHAVITAFEEQYGRGDGVDTLASEGQWILPERIIPADVREYGSSVMGPQEPWGKSRFIENPADMKLFHSIETFNKKHGPSLAEQFFRGTPVDETK